MKRLITVYEALKMCDKDLLFNEVLKTYSYLKNPLNPTQMTFDFINECLNLTPIESDELNVVSVDFDTEYDEDKEEYYLLPYSNVSEFKKDQAYKPILAIERLKNMDNTSLSDKELNKIEFQMNKEKAPSFAYELCKTDTILSFYISISNIERIGLEKMLAHILFEMTYFGFKVSINENEKNSIYSSMESVCKDIVESENENKIVECQENESSNDINQSLADDDLEPEKEETIEETKERLRKKIEIKRIQRECRIANLISSVETYNEIVKDINDGE